MFKAEKFGHQNLLSLVRGVKVAREVQRVPRSNAVLCQFQVTKRKVLFEHLYYFMAPAPEELGWLSAGQYNGLRSAGHGLNGIVVLSTYRVIYFQ